jgi:recombination protein RecT
MNSQMVPTGEMAKVKNYLQAVTPHLQQVATKVLTPEKITKIVTSAVSRQPMLLKAFQESPHSILRCVFAATQLGLDPDSPLGQCYMVPFRNNKNGGKHEAQFIIGYRGLIDLARRSGNIVSIRSRVVREKDEFEVEYGLTESIKHKPFEGPGAGKLRAVYAVAELKDGGIQYEIMWRHEIDAIKDRSKASKYGPWVTDYAEMARKTVIRRLSKYLPMSVDMARAIEHEDASNNDGVSTIDAQLADLPMLPEFDEEAQETDQPTASSNLGDRLMQQAGAK